MFMIRYQQNPPLNPISKSVIGVDGHPFEIDGVTYINLTMRTENKEIFVIEYEPVIVTSKIDMCINNMHGTFAT